MTHLPMTRELRLLGATALLLTLGACGHEFEPPDRADHIAAAEALYSAELFDTLTWESDYARTLEGNSVYASQCRKCHGSLGLGGTEYSEVRGLDVPSLVEWEWKFTDGLESVRHYVFVGHDGGMPSWGLSGLSPREIDGAAYYLLAQLRPEMLAQQ